MKKIDLLTDKNCVYAPQKVMYNNWIDNINEATGLLSTPKRIYSYLYSMDFGDVDYNFANSYYAANGDKFNPGRCTSVRRGNLYARNLDWYLNQGVEFVVRVTAAEGRYGSIAVGGGLSKMTKAFVESHQWNDDAYRLVPFAVNDGINEKGVFINSNVVITGEKGSITSGTNPGKPRMSSVELIRHTLDHYASAREAVTDIRDNIDVYCPNHPLMKGYESHLMIGDATDTFIIEFIDNQCVVIKGAAGATTTTLGMDKIMTNFYITDAELKTVGSVTTVDPASITKFSCGVERYNNAIKEYNTLTGLTEMMTFMSGYQAAGTQYSGTNLMYTNSYTRNPQTDYANFWGTEFVGEYDYEGSKVQLKAQDLLSEEAGAGYTPTHLALLQSFIAGFSPDDRSGKFWQTVHTSVYDIDKKVVYVVSQEGREAKGMAFCINGDLDYLFNKDYVY